MTASPPAYEVVRVDPNRTNDAMSALLGAGPAAAARFVQQAKSAAIRLDLIWCVADASGRYRFAVLAVPSVGRTAMLVASHARDAAESATLGRAVAAACEGTRAEADLAQALVDPALAVDIASFEAGGLRRMATLEYLERALPRSGPLPPPAVPPGWSIEPIAPRDILDGADPHALGAECRQELVALLESTYVDTMDCPGLAGMRATADVLDGHFGSGARRRHWFIAREGEQGARASNAGGLCLLNASPDGTSAELAYFGVAPSARGRGIARALLAVGLHACSNARISTVTLAVDARNLAAKRLYDAHGFRKTISRVALVKPLRASAAV
jgi:ribosomal protein S18 acetylase RimI-like enzyme